MYVYAVQYSIHRKYAVADSEKGTSSGWEANNWDYRRTHNAAIQTVGRPLASYTSDLCPPYMEPYMEPYLHSPYMAPSTTACLQYIFATFTDRHVELSSSRATIVLELL